MTLCLVMKKIIVIIFIFSFTIQVWGQKKAEIGLFGGTSYYLGDINPTKQFYGASPSLGGIFRYSINPRYAVRANLFYGKLKGNDLDFSSPFQQQRAGRFSSNILETALQFEINFLSFQPREHTTIFSPYISAGVGYSFMINSSSGAPSHATIPFAIGVKTSFSRRVTLGFEWGARKTFNDKVDGLLNPGGDTYKSAFHNNDWYYFTGFSISYKLFDDKGNCPVYQ